MQYYLSKERGRLGRLKNKGIIEFFPQVAADVFLHRLAVHKHSQTRTATAEPDSAGYLSAILQEWCKVSLGHEGAANGPMCSVIDVGSKTVHPGVKATTARMKDVEAICQNIAALWPTI